MKCPECNKELSKDDILIPIRDKDTGEIMDWYHSDYKLFNDFIETCNLLNRKPGDVIEELEEFFITVMSKVKQK